VLEGHFVLTQLMEFLPRRQLYWRISFRRAVLFDVALERKVATAKLAQWSDDSALQRENHPLASIFDRRVPPMKRNRRTMILLCAALASLAVPYRAQAAKGNPRVIPPRANYRGLSYGEWDAQWWSNLLSTPVVNGSQPYLDGGAFEGENGVLFLVGIPGGATFDITIPPGTPLFFPVVSIECSVFEPDPFHGDDEASLRACAKNLMDNTSGLFAVIDGVPVQDLDSYRVTSPLFEWGPLPEDNLFAFFGFDAPAGTTSLAVDDGVWLLLPPLSVGTHELHFGGTFDSLGFGIDTTYRVTVAPGAPVPEPSTLLCSVGLLAVVGYGRRIRKSTTGRVAD
jgi:hypothetical protein